MHLLLIYGHSSEEFSRTARYNVNNVFLTHTVNNYQTCYPLKNPQFNHAETHAQGQTVHLSPLLSSCFSVSQSGMRNVPNQREQNVIYVSYWETAQILPPAPLLSLYQFWAALLWPRLGKNKCWRDRSSSWSTGSGFTRKCKQISTKAETSFCAVS